MVKKYDFKEIEQTVGKYWVQDKDRIFSSLQFPKANEKLYSWVEGPPTANAPPAIHHVEVRVYKDLFLRFKAMQGYIVARKGGWDCHGLPVEVQVEKKLKLKDKKEVVEYGVGKFIDECKTDVFKFIKDWNESTEKLAFWVDLDNAYKTLDTNYMESVWWSLKEIHNKGLLYKGHKVVPMCPRCETPLSSHEVAQGYKNVEEKSVTVQVKLKDEDAYLLVWTTTPWTLPGNNSIAMHPDIEYVFVEDKGEFKGKTFVLAKELVPKYFPEHTINKTVKGEYFKDKLYQPIFPYFPKIKNGYKILMADYVNTEEGTGLVHQAAAYGEIDYEVNKEHEVEFFHVLDRQARFVPEVVDFAGMFAKDADPLIIEWLRKQEKLFVEYAYKHDYPFCWRCDSPLIYYAMDSWFIAVSKIRDKLVKINDQINWYPNHIKEGRFGNWIAEAKDWALSRNKFWGTPLPIWVCEDCNHLEAIGSIKELMEKGKINGKPIGKPIDDLHIMTVNPIEIDCPKCKKPMKRTPEVIDCWYDSGSATFAQWHYPFEHKAEFERAFPYDYIVEAVDQTRGWFYTLHVLAAILFDKPAYKNVAVAGLMCDEKGEKMSKSKGNIIQPNEIFDKYGVDATRLVMASYALGNQLKFGDSQFQEIVMPFFNTLWNTYNFISPIIAEKAKKIDPKNLKVEDNWILLKLKKLTIDLTNHLDNHEYNVGLTKIMEYVEEDMSRWYIKLIRDRVDDEKEHLNSILSHCFETLMRLLAPYAPYITEYLYREVYDKSVHFESWPRLETLTSDEENLQEDMANAREIVAGVLGARDKAGIGVRWPLAECIIDTQDEKIKRAVASLSELIKKQTNIKEIVVKKFAVEYDMKPNYRNLGKEFGQETADVIGLIQKEKKKVIDAITQGNEAVNLGKYKIVPDHINLVKQVPVEFSNSDIKGASIYLLKSMNEELEEEGFTREVIRRVQQLRKEAELQKTDRINLAIITKYPNLTNHADHIKEKVGADSIVIAEKCEKNFKHTSRSKIKDIEFEIRL
ncbi:MAG: isoleucine--tRNA ligase [Nanoarchaeota archaeon]|nr:isoleucine--tRNA ligase [Nanoarchaeota archaeon]